MNDDAKSRPSFSPRRRWRIGFDVVLRTAIVLAIVMMANYLSAQFFHRFYLSSSAREALSSRTLSILNSLTNRVTITLYYDTHDDPKNFYPTLLALANEYHAVNKNISVRTVDYLRDPGEAEKVKEQFNLPGTSDSPNAPPSKDLIIFSSGDVHAVVPGEAIVKYQLEQTASDNPKELEFRKKPVAFNGEVMFTSKLLALSNPQPFKACFLQGDGESSLTDTGPYGFSTFALVLAQNNIAVQNLELSGNAPVPVDCNLLIVAAPVEEIPPPTLQAISRYLDEGGRLLVFMNRESIERPTGLETILQRWGINILPDIVKDPQGTITGQDVRVNLFNLKTYMNPLAGLSLQMIFPRPVARVVWDNPPANAPQVDELAFSSGFSTLISDPAAPPRSYPLMAAAQQKPVAGVSTPRGVARIVAVGDSIFMGNHYIEGGDNRDFLSYTVNWLLDREELLSGISPRPVTEFRLMLTQIEQRQLSWLLLGALPGGVLLLGGLVWFVRRK